MPTRIEGATSPGSEQVLTDEESLSLPTEGVIFSNHSGTYIISNFDNYATIIETKLTPLPTDRLPLGMKPDIFDGHEEFRDLTIVQSDEAGESFTSTVRVTNLVEEAPQQ